MFACMLHSGIISFNQNQRTEPRTVNLSEQERGREGKRRPTGKCNLKFISFVSLTFTWISANLYRTECIIHLHSVSVSQLEEQAEEDELQSTSK